ncbi:carbohydrate ABC transporter permease [Paenibacillus sp. strain BS8-2]
MNQTVMFRIRRSILIAVLVLFCAFELFPLVWMLNFSLLKSGEFYSTDILKWPSPFQWNNYRDAFVNAEIARLFKNSLLITAFSIAIIVVTSVMMGYAFSRMTWKLKGFFMSIILIGIIIPFHATLLPNFVLFNELNMLNSSLVLILPYAGFSIPVSMLIISGYIRSIPRSLEEAAVMDGLGLFGIIFRIVLPILKPAIMTVMILAFIGCWNEFVLAITYISTDEWSTLPFALMRFTGEYASNYGAQFAVMSIIALPSIIAYVLFSDQINSGITAGAIKG